VIEFLVFLASGRLLQFFAKRFPPLRDTAQKREFTKELYECNLCSGVWVYFFLSLFTDIDMKIKNKLVGKLILACLSSLMAYLISLGYEEAFGKYVIEDVGT